MGQYSAGEPADDFGINLPVVEDESLPKQFGKYTLLRKIAAGGMAEIFLALQRSVAGFEKLIVIKRILPSMNQDNAFIEMLLHEARIAATLSHPNIVQIFDVGQVDGTYFIAMEHIHGEDIRSIVRSMKKKGINEFPLEHSLAIGLGMCSGLAYAHDKRTLNGELLHIVHRDISPQNIVVTFTGDVKIVDFGIAKSGTQIGEDTKDGQLKGKVPYMSPEQASGHDLDWRSDIFAVGVLLFELTTGKRLFKGASEFETLKLICDKEYPLPTTVRPGYSIALERIVMKALAKKREDRYQSAREMQGDLEAVVREEKIPISQISLAHWMESLFQDKLARQKEALHDVKQLADMIASQHSPSLYDASMITGNVGLMSAPGSATTIATQPKRTTVSIAVIAGTVALAALAAFFYMRNLAATREAERALQEAEAQAARAAAEAEAQALRGWIEIDSQPAGSSIWINGDLRQEITPAKIEGLPFGKEIKIKLSQEGLEAYRETITLSPEAPSRKISAAMQAGSVTVVLKIDPPSTIWVDNKPWKGDKNKIVGLSAGEEHKIVLSAMGFLPKTITFTAQQNETKVFTERLVKGDPNAVPDKPPDKSGGTGPAKVRVGAKGGFCNVTVNGTSYGPTPVEAVVPAGNVRISCKPSSGAAMSQSIKVNPGETGRVSFKIP